MSGSTSNSGRRRKREVIVKLVPHEKTNVRRLVEAMVELTIQYKQRELMYLHELGVSAESAMKMPSCTDGRIEHDWKVTRKPQGDKPAKVKCLSCGAKL